MCSDYTAYQEWLQEHDSVLLKQQCCDVHDRMLLIQSQSDACQNFLLLSHLVSTTTTTTTTLTNIFAQQQKPIVRVKIPVHKNSDGLSWQPYLHKSNSST